MVEGHLVDSNSDEKLIIIAAMHEKYVHVGECCLISDNNKSPVLLNSQMLSLKKAKEVLLSEKCDNSL